MNALQEAWPDDAKKPKRKNKPEDGAVPTHIDPDCKACGGTGVNSKQGQCSPCVANGARIKRRGATAPKLPEAPAAPTPPSPPAAPKKKKGKTTPPPPPKKDKEKEGERNRNAARAPRPPKPPPPPPPPKKKTPPPPPPPPRDPYLDGIMNRGKKPPPPPPKKRAAAPPPPPKKPSKAKEKTPRGQPQAPPSVGKTYGPGSDKKPPRLKAPTFFAVCIQVRLDSPYEETVVVDELNRYVVEQTGFGANVQEARQLGPQVFDLRVHYAVHLTEVFDVIEGHNWVEKAQALPIQDLGKGEPIV
jgi:hypothetical protein